MLRRTSVLALALLAPAPLPLHAASAPAVPYTIVQISGSQATGTSGPAFSYRAYQAPGETFRIVCQEPCALSEDLIFAAYAGFRPAKQQLVAMAGLDSLPALQPFDIHLNGDSWCGPFHSGLTGDAGTYYFAGTGTRGSFGCFWDVEKAGPQQPPYLPVPFTPDDAIRIDRQLLRVHEYGHTIFYDRHYASYEDLVKAFSFAIASINGKFVTDPCDTQLKDFSQGRLAYTLCRDTGFAFSDLAPAMQQLDAEFRAGLGEGNVLDVGIPPATSISQLRQLLAARLGRDATDAFVGAAFTAAQAGASAPMPSTGRVTFGAGAVTLAASGVPNPPTVTLGAVYTAPNAGTWDFDFGRTFRLGPDGTSFPSPAWLTFRYDPYYASDVSEAGLKLARVAGNAWSLVPGAVVDVQNGTVSAPVTALGTFTLLGTAKDAALPARAIATVASAPGQFGSFYRTAVQLVNTTFTSFSGRLVFHPGGAPGSASDPSLPVTLTAWQVKSIDDLLPAMGTSGSGSVDLVVTSGNPPVAVVRVFNDGASGTTGVSEDAVKPEAALLAGQRGVLVLPPDFATQRMNVGVRTFGAGASATLTLRAASGAVARQLTKSWGANFYEQKSVADFLGGPALSGNESVEVTVTAGSLVVYGATGDNTTNDPSLQLLRPVLDGALPGAPLVVPTVVSAPGQFGAFYRTAVQLQNPGASAATGKLVFHPAGRSASASDPALAYTLDPGQTRFLPDLLPAMGQSGSGSLDVVPATGVSPRAVVRVFNDAGAAGTSGLTEEALPPAAALQPGEHVALLLPADLANFRMNVGIRTFERGAKVTVVARSAQGFFRKLLTKSWGPDFYEQVSAADFLGGLALEANLTIEVLVDGGSLVVYGATADNRTNDPSLQLPGRAPLF